MQRRTKRCSKCHKEYDESLNFCLDDGTPLAAIPSVYDAESPTLILNPKYNTKPIGAEPLGLQVVVQSEAGEMQSFKENEWAGTVGLSRGLEGFSLRIVPSLPNLSLRYKGHFRETGDTDFIGEGEFLRSPKQGRCLGLLLFGKKSQCIECGYFATFTNCPRGPRGAFFFRVSPPNCPFSCRGPSRFGRA